MGEDTTQEVHVVAVVTQSKQGEVQFRQLLLPFRYVVGIHPVQLVADPEHEAQGDVQRAHTVPLRNSVPRQSLHVPLSSPLPG